VFRLLKGMCKKLWPTREILPERSCIIKVHRDVYDFGWLPIGKINRKLAIITYTY